MRVKRKIKYLVSDVVVKKPTPMSEVEEVKEEDKDEHMNKKTNTHSEPYEDEHEYEDDYEDEDEDIPLVIQNDDGSNKYVTDKYDIESIKSSYSATKKWIAIISVHIGFWMAILIPIIILIEPYIKQCDPINTFGEFSICIIIYVIIQSGVDLTLAVLSFKKTKHFLESESIKEIEYIMSLKPKGKIMNGPHTTPDAMDASVKMGNIINIHNSKIETLSSKIQNITPEACKVRSGMISSNEMYSALKDLDSVGKKYGAMTKKAGENKHTINIMSKGAKIISTVSLVPILTILFFVIIGSGSLAKVRAHQDAIGNGGENIVMVCKVSYGLNWTVLLLCIIENIIRAIPVLGIYIRKLNDDVVIASRNRRILHAD